MFKSLPYEFNFSSTEFFTSIFSFIFGIIVGYSGYYIYLKCKNNQDNQDNQDGHDM